MVFYHRVLTLWFFSSNSIFSIIIMTSYLIIMTYYFIISSFFFHHRDFSPFYGKKWASTSVSAWVPQGNFPLHHGWQPWLFLFCASVFYTNHMYTLAHIMRQGDHITDRGGNKEFQGRRHWFLLLVPLFPRCLSTGSSLFSLCWIEKDTRAE